MQSGKMISKRRPASAARHRLVLLLALGALLPIVAGTIAAGMINSRARLSWEQGRSVPAASIPVSTARPVTPDLAGMSPRALAQYRAFYEQQMSSEAALERWSLPPSAAAKLSPQQRARYERHMALEADLAQWSGPGPALTTPEAVSPAPRVTEGAQYK